MRIKSKAGSFFKKLTGISIDTIDYGTKGVDEAVRNSLTSFNEEFFKIEKFDVDEVGDITKHSLLKRVNSLEMEIPFPTLVEVQGNVLEYEDFSESRIDRELNANIEKLLNIKT